MCKARPTVKYQAGRLPPGIYKIPANFLVQELLQLFGLPPGNPLISFVGLSSKRAGPSYWIFSKWNRDLTISQKSRPVGRGEVELPPEGWRTGVSSPLPGRWHFRKSSFLASSHLQHGGDLTWLQFDVGDLPSSIEPWVTLKNACHTKKSFSAYSVFLASSQMRW